MCICNDFKISDTDIKGHDLMHFDYLNIYTSIRVKSLLTLATPNSSEMIPSELCSSIELWNQFLFTELI